jgi:hypothetical protein
VATAAKVGTAMAEVTAKKYGADKTLKAVILGGYPSEVVTQLRSDGFKKGRVTPRSRAPRSSTFSRPSTASGWLTRRLHRSAN